MIWAQGGLSFLIWLGYGVLLTRKSASIRTWSQSVASKHRVRKAIALMLGSAAVVFAILNILLVKHGFGENGMTTWAWLVVILLGLILVHSQMLATALLVSNVQESVTAERLQASSTHRSPEIEEHEAPSP